MRKSWVLGTVALWARLVLGLAEGAEPAQGLAPHDVANLRHVTEVAMSPDARYVGYVGSVPRKPGIEEDGEAWCELWVMARAEGTPRPFVTGHVKVEAVQWSPDSRSLGFLAKRGEDKFKSLYVMAVDGGEARRAVTMESDISAFSFAPDGRRVAVVAADPEAQAKQKAREKGFKQEVYEEDGRPAQVRIAVLFETNPPVVVPIEGTARGVRWSPAGDLLAVAVTPTPSVDDGMMRQRLRVVRADDGRVVARVENPGKLDAFEWSPNGRRLALLAAADRHDPSAGRLMVAEVRDGAPEEVWPGFEGEFEDFAWQGDGHLLFVAAQRAQTFLGKLAVGGPPGSARTLIPAGTAVWTDLALSADGQHGVLAGHTAQHPAEVFTMSHGEAGPRRRTDSNPWLASRRLGAQEIVQYRARDGLEIDGVLVHPLARAGEARVPLILDVHGGPEAHVSNGWLTSYSRPGQVAAARGMAVFYPNYRGSTDRGVAFSKLGQGDAAGKEFDDLVDAVDHLVAMGLAEAKKVGVTGGSYGGYATAWCSTRYSERFAAGVMFVGISDKVSKVGTTDIPDEEYYVHARKRPWEDWLFLLERSPIYHAAKGRTPLLILHGKDDPRVDVGQSRELYRHLKLHGQAPVRLVLYPGEGHGNRKAAARLDYSLRMFQWFEHFLQGPGGPMPGPEIEYGLGEKKADREAKQ